MLLKRKKLGRPPKPKRPVRKAAKPRASKAYAVTPQSKALVQAMAMISKTQAEIAAALEIDVKTLVKHFRGTLDTAKTRAHANIAANIYKQGMKDDFRAIPAAKLFAESQMGWRAAPQDVTLRGAVGVFDPSKYTDDELADLERRLSKGEVGGPPRDNKG